MTGTAIVFCGGGPVRAPVPNLDRALVIAADSGASEALRLGYKVDLVVGDMDSIYEATLEAVRASGGAVERHTSDNDATHLELALDRATASGATRIIVAGGGGGRLDHLLGNLTLLASPRFEGVRIDAVFGAATVHVIRGRREIPGEQGRLVSLFALGGPARGVTTTGLRWALADAELSPGSSLGISNEMTEEVASVEVSEGVVAAVLPGDER
jgi:thiamine pyrophosphokinase